MVLARIDWQGLAPKTDVIAEYNGFPWWHGLLVPPNAERKAADWLKRVNVFAYWPTFVKQCRSGGRRPHIQRAKLCAAIPGMIFIPQEMMDMERRDEVFDYAGVRGYIRTTDGSPKPIAKADIELIRLMEAKLNLPPEAKGVLFKMRQKVRFLDGSLWQAWGNGLIVEIASEHRIGIEVSGLFGRTTKVYVPAHEIEAM
jgi:transcription antitermination factor NusG